ncbi:MAG: VOC family protein [Deltaproteobacteria bacterium]|nr:VOC family protein [Deltaproteobacteria bacterium]
MNTHRFVWHDLNTKDLQGSQRFYGEIFNWTFKSDDNYVHISAGSQMIGGMRQMSPQEPYPTNWMGYIAVDDVAATVGKITSAGGQVHMPATKMENVGTFAVTADPSGGVFAPWKSARPGEDVEKIGMPAMFTFSWDELVTTDPDAAAKFYATVFGWKPNAMPMGNGETYTLFERPGVKNFKGDPAAAGGMMKSPPGVPYSFWLPYVQVDNCDSLCERATRLGGKVMVPGTDIPNVGRFACWSDPQGASIAVIQPPR